MIKRKWVFCIPTDGWIGLKVNNISCRKIVGEAASFCSSDVEKWKSQLWADEIQDYEEKNNFNADVAGLF